jgi:hypothetical protein
MLGLILALLSPLAAYAAPADFYGEFFGPIPGMGSRVRVEQRVFQSEYAAGQPFALEQTHFDTSFPVTGSSDVFWRGTAFTDFDAIQSGANFSNGRVMPNQLWDPGGGLSRTQNLEGGKVLGGSITVSSPSNQPYAAFRDVGLNMHLSYKLPQENGNAWIFFLAFSNTRGYLDYVPLPGVAYFFQAGPTFRGIVGIPFLMLNWLPAKKWNLTAFYFPIRNAELRATFGNLDSLQAYAFVSIRTRTYMMSDRTDIDERLFSEEGLTQVGLIVPVSKGIALDLGGGQSFARRYFLGDKESDRSVAPTIQPDNELYAAAKMQASF